MAWLLSATLAAAVAATAADVPPQSGGGGWLLPGERMPEGGRICRALDALDAGKWTKGPTQICR